MICGICGESFWTYVWYDAEQKPLTNVVCTCHNKTCNAKKIAAGQKIVRTSNGTYVNGVKVIYRFGWYKQIILKNQVTIE